MKTGSIRPEVIANISREVSVLDFRRCVRSNGTAYGTAGECRKGVESPLKEQISRITSLHKSLKKLRSQKLPWGEEKWRAEEIESDIHKTRKEALEKAKELGAKGAKALKDFNDADFRGIASTLSEGELNEKISIEVYDYITYKGDKNEKERVKEIVQRLKILISNLPKEQERAEELYRLDVLTGKVKLPRPGTLTQTLKSGKDFLKKDLEGLKSSASILRRASLLEVELRERSKREEEEKKPGWIRRKLEISSSIMKLAQRRGNAEQRLNAKMAGIRERLLKTKLSEEEVERLVSRVLMTKEGKSKVPSGELLTETRGQLREFVRLFNGKGLVAVSDGEQNRAQLSRLIINPEKRAFAYADTGFISSNGSKQTLFHEVGHIVEGQRKWLSDFSIKWRDTKAFSQGKISKDTNAQILVGGKSSPAISPVSSKTQSGRSAPIYALDDMLPLKGKGYSKDEVAVVDTFVSPYMGKVYKERFTEVVSMTVEHFAEPYLMSHLFKHHPDLFVLGVGLASS